MCEVGNITWQANRTGERISRAAARYELDLTSRESPQGLRDDWSASMRYR
jgi:hypothetical protein